jgi:hypothetical protein
MSVNSERVKVSVESVVLPTCGMGFDNPNTLFFETGGYLQDNTYPSPFHAHFLREKPVDKSYRLIVVENEYLRVEFAPELGGRIWRLLDKVHNEDAVHYNDSIKPYPGGFGGAYTAGGMELNYPFAHSITNTWPRKTEFVENEDGSVTYTVSEWERTGRTLWAMSFTLSPGESRLKQQVKFYNRSKLPLSYMYWGNAGVPASMDTKWIYRECMGSEHGGDTVFCWPEFRGTDLSLYKNDCEVVGIYFLEPKYNFFGLTDQKTKAGLIHHANRFEVPGRKLWTWGRNWNGENRSWHLSMKPQYYGESQSGRPVNQEHFDWLMPEEFLTWKEEWAPINGLTDVTEVTDECAFQILGDERKVLCYPFAPIQDRQLKFVLDGKTIKESTFSGETSKLSEIDLSDIPVEKIEGLEIKIIKDRENAGCISLHNKCERKLPKDIQEQPPFNESSSIAYFVNAEFSHRLLYRKKALTYYKKSIELDDLNYKSYTGLGRLLFGYGDFESAKENFRKSIDIYKWDPEPYLMLSHIHQLQGKTEEALECAFNARYYGEWCRSNLRVGEIHILQQEYASAIGYIDEALINNKMSLRAYGLKALSLRKLGAAEEALSALDESPDAFLKDLLWYSERYFLGKLSEAELKDGLFNDDWRFLELGLVYTELGLYEEAEQLIDIGLTIQQDGWTLPQLYNPDRIWGITRQRETPFLHILKGYIAVKAGREADAKKAFAAGDYIEYHVNFNQPELEAILKTAIEYGNGAANHYLGNFLFHGFRCDEAAKFWQAAEEKCPNCSLNKRNLAVYAQFVENDKIKARDLRRAALKANPTDLFLRQELAADERACGASEADVLDLFIDAPEDQKSTFLLTRGLLAAYMSADKWKEGAEYLASLDRRYCDEDSGWYAFAIGYADHLIDANKPKEALEWIAKARPNPANLSYVNYPEEWMYLHQEYYLHGLALKMLGDSAEAEKYFRKGIEQKAELHWFKPFENYTNLLRFYTALSMKELGMEAAANCVLGGVNTYRETQALVFLGLVKSDLKRWNEQDPDSTVVVHKHAGPEI